MAYANVRSFTIDHTKVPSTQANFPVLFSSICDTLSGGINNSVTTIPATVGKQVQDGDNILIDSEQMAVTGGGGTASWTVLRAQNGTSAASHSSGAPITNLFLASTSNGGGVTSASGFDLIFATDSGGTSPVAYERVVWTATQGLLEAHVLVASASSSVDTVLYILWGDASVTTDQSNPTAVWDANYKLIAHFPDGTTLGLADSTGLNTGTNHSATATSGEIDGAANFNGSSQYIDFGNSTPLNITGDITMEAWVLTTTPGTCVIAGQLSAAVTNGYQFYLQGSSIVLNFFNAGFQSFLITSSTIANNTLTLVSARRTSGTMKVFFNGADAGIFLTQNQGSSTTGSSTELFYVGRNAANFYWPGKIDELRVSSVARSDDWIAAGYNTQSSPNTFYSLGTFAPPPTGGIIPQIMHHRRLQNAA